MTCCQPAVSTITDLKIPSYSFATSSAAAQTYHTNSHPRILSASPWELDPSHTKQIEPAGEEKRISRACQNAHRAALSPPTSTPTLPSSLLPAKPSHRDRSIAKERETAESDQSAIGEKRLYIRMLSTPKCTSHAPIAQSPDEAQPLTCQ